MGDSGACRVLIADDHPIFLDGLSRLLETEPGIEVVCQAGDGERALELARQLQPDLIMVNVLFLQAAGSILLQSLISLPWVPRVILLATRVDKQQLLTALQLGIRGVVFKDSTPAALRQSIRSVRDGAYALGREMTDIVDAMRRLSRRTAPPSNAYHLTARQMQIISGIAAGETNREIAERLSLSEETVKRHLSHIFDKLGVFSRVELAVFAINHGLIDDAMS
jgi:two-component system nitrate/nitrite response regulator NarL